MPDEGETSDDLYAEEAAVVAERKLSKAQIDKQRAEVMHRLLATAPGREFVAWLMLDICGIAAQHTPSDVASAHYQAGARGIGLTLQKQALQSAPRLYMVLLAENAHKF